MPALLALASAFCYGVVDFGGGLLSRRAEPTQVALVGQVAAVALTVVVAPLVAAPQLGPEDVGWGALSGVGTGVGMAFLYRGLSRGSMSVVVPLIAVAGTAIPVLVGIALLGDRPSVLSWAGIALALPALLLISLTGQGTDPAGPRGVPDALVSSLGIAVQYLALAQADPGAGLWPIVAGRLAASATILPLLVGRLSRLTELRRLDALAAALVGCLAALALTLYMLAAQRELVTIAVVLSSLYPVIPVLLGITVLRERVSARQVLGLGAAAAAVALISAG